MLLLCSKRVNPNLDRWLVRSDVGQNCFVDVPRGTNNPALTLALVAKVFLPYVQRLGLPSSGTCLNCEVIETQSFTLTPHARVVAVLRKLGMFPYGKPINTYIHHRGFRYRVLEDQKGGYPCLYVTLVPKT